MRIDGIYKDCATVYDLKIAEQAVLMKLTDEYDRQLDAIKAKAAKAEDTAMTAKERFTSTLYHGKDTE